MSTKTGRLIGKTAIITGGTGNLGAAIVKKLSEEGADVLFTYLKNEKKAESLKFNSKIFKTTLFPIKCDIRNKDEIQKTVEVALKKFKKVDILVNNVAIDSTASIFDTTDNLLNDTLALNIRGPHYFTKYIAPIMIKQKYGKIINISAVAGIIGATSSAIYHASKAGLIGMTKKWALELGPYNINVNAIAPGVILRNNTNQDILNEIRNYTPLKKIVKPEDIANAVLFLASPDSDMITGQTLIVDGGTVMF